MILTHGSSSESRRDRPFRIITFRFSGRLSAAAEPRRWGQESGATVHKGEFHMSSEIALENMTVVEKLQLMERLWDDLARRPQDVPSPDWHGDVLAERMKAVREGRTSFEDWDDVKRRLQARFE